GQSHEKRAPTKKATRKTGSDTAKDGIMPSETRTNAAKTHTHAHPHGSVTHSHSHPQGVKGMTHSHRIKKNIIDNVDPQIGPQFSVGHMKPSDLSPESSMKNKAIRKALKGISKALSGGYTTPGGGTRPVTMPKAGSPGTPSGYGSTGMPQYNYQRK